MSEIVDITELEGFYVGQATHAAAGTGCTCIICPEGATGAVDVRGGAPATRETDLLRPEETVDELNAVVLSGGSAFGLAASCGVADELERRGIGLDVGVARVPIVSSACLFDLACGDSTVRPTMEDGSAAVTSALDGDGHHVVCGNVGAGTGCTVGKLAGPERAMKSGLGGHVEHAGDITCAAISAVNACGNICDPDTGDWIAGLRADASSREVVSESKLLLDAAATMPLPRTNTTISCVILNVSLTKAQATKVAQMAADAYAHAIRPTHTTNDGDTIFVMARGTCTAPVDLVGTLACHTLERAIARGASTAEGAFGFPGAAD